MLDVFSAAAVRLQNLWFRARDEETAQGLVEYALIIAIVSIGAIVALGLLRDSITNLFNKTATTLSSQ